MRWFRLCTTNLGAWVCPATGTSTHGEGSFSNLCKGPYEPVVALLYVSTGVWQKRLVGQGGGRVSDVWLATLSLEPPWSGLRNGFLVSRADSSDGWELLEVCGEGLESSRTRTVALGVVSRVCCGC